MANIYPSPPGDFVPLPGPPPTKLPAATPPPATPNWRYGEDQYRGRPRSTWETDPEGYMRAIMEDQGRGIPIWLQDYYVGQAGQQRALWSAYNDAMRTGALGGGNNPRPLGDWLASMVTGQNTPWAGSTLGPMAPGRNPAVATDQERERSFYNNILNTLLGSGEIPSTWRRSMEPGLGRDAAYPSQALSFILQASGLSPALQSFMLSRDESDRMGQQYRGRPVTPGGPAPDDYVTWLSRRMRGR